MSAGETRQTPLEPHLRLVACLGEPCCRGNGIPTEPAVPLAASVAAEETAYCGADWIFDLSGFELTEAG